MNSTLIVSFRGKKVELPLVPGITVGDVKGSVSSQANETKDLSSTDIKLMFKGKVLCDDKQEFVEIVGCSPQKLQKTYRLIAIGLSQAEAAQVNDEFESQQRIAPRIRDDLSESGVQEMRERQRKANLLMRQADARLNAHSGEKYGFGQVETLRGLPDEHKAREILETLANDPGILACMTKHKWKVGSLTEMYPEGKVGESAVCIMGLNENKGQRIKLRIRTDDLKGFRKMQSIRKVLFHELAHNVHSEHDGDFFVLMRQVEKECIEMDWTKGAGLSSDDFGPPTSAIQGGTYRLGGDKDQTPRQYQHLSRRELALRAALQRMTAEEHEIEDNCACGRSDLFLPDSKNEIAAGVSDERSTSSGSKHTSDDMDLSQ